MADPEPVVMMDDEHLWPSPEMRERAIDAAVLRCGNAIANRIQKEIEDRLKVSIDSWIKEIMSKVTEFQKIAEESKQVLTALQGVDRSDFAKTTKDLTARMHEIETQLILHDQRAMGLSNSHDIKSALKSLFEVIKTTTECVRSHRGYYPATTINDYEMKNRVMGDLIAEIGKTVMGYNFDKLENIGRAASNL